MIFRCLCLKYPAIYFTLFFLVAVAIMQLFSDSKQKGHIVLCLPS